MKKTLMILFCLLCVQNAYCDKPPFNIDEELLWKDFTSGKIDLAAAIAMCRAFCKYADAHKIVLKLECGKNGETCPLTLKDCDPEPNRDNETNLKGLFYIDILAARELSKLKIEETQTPKTGNKEHSQCHQSLMEDRARSYMTEKYIENYRRDGYKISSFSDRFIVDCSKTDDRCVVNRPASKDGKNVFYSVCSLIPVISCDSNKTSSAGSSLQNVSAKTGIIHVPWYGITNQSLTLNDFDAKCEPKSSSLGGEYGDGDSPF